ncbi:zinc finger protein GAI-ASSOCIATED FACTOR 1-like [Coffea eugenioides]|uniref:zinc finger protein GAI-ASSOCIATED FACTOR 1-like n=1 Tax=Coffea eugenioides TaxID=49369 RepID=UPI000F609894|nr:zinc finger protein GAI-ASSOCIATED FACTOR 1-like [Coffea eugenioides]
MNNSSAMATVPSASEEASVSSAGNPMIAAQVGPVKKKRNLPGMPDPDAEVIALSPKTLLATNRFVCEICNKGFQRDQNLQLHRRGHNLPWKLRQRNGKEVKKRVYVCPEATCIHHDPSRALGDLTGIKKHFCRKHGEKKWKCERCSKKYAVISDWKAHTKTCGTREYRCDCGTLFSRRDSFITHRAFCDALAQESARSQTQTLAITNEEGTLKVQAQTTTTRTSSSSPPPPPLTPSTGVLSPVLSIHSSEMPENLIGRSQPQPGTPQLSATSTTSAAAATAGNSSSPSDANVSSTTGVFASILGASGSAGLSRSSQSPSSFSGLLCAMGGPERSAVEPISLSLSSSLYLSNHPSTLFPSTPQDHHPRHYSTNPQPALSATALLQKAAQIGAASSGSSFLRGLGLAMPSSSDLQDNCASPSTATAPATASASASTANWMMRNVKPENGSVAPGQLGLGLASDHAASGLTDLMMGPPTIFGGKPTTLDFLGLGMAPGAPSSDGISAYLSSMRGGGLDVAAVAATSTFGGINLGGSGWDDSSDRKPTLL